MAIEWSEATDDLLQRAQALIADHHPELVDVRIVFMFRSDPALSRGKIAYAQTQKVSQQMRMLLDDADFIIWVSYRDWHNKSIAWGNAVLDHALYHCGIEEDSEGNTAYYIKPHDIEEFHEVIARHGAWTIEIQQTESAIRIAQGRQLMFVFQDADKPDNHKTQRGAAYTVEVKRFAGALND